ncbi:Crp/Fnr family transcriptional regulator [Lachnospiraceae bacterium NSJ-29]|uniref:Crp/Fnr family transcriptional regulator n=1 Tax=Wansuia hejianensis TaxID=2763667 RepID=A0A926EWG0_9FIRM|nr:Crp/Fnr family transcriptional regulator [Wansuia hejianensis]
MHNIPLFSNLDNDEISKISEGVTTKVYKKGQHIFKTGDKADKLYIVCSGKMKIYKYLSDGREQILYIYSAGDFVGAFNLLKEDEFKYNAEAIEDVAISTLDKTTFNEIAIKNPNITLKILEKGYERIRWAEELVDRLSSANADAKVAGLLLDLIKDFGTKTREGTVLNLSINREEMGSYAGISRETMTRKLKHFQELGYIDFIGNKKIIILDEERLSELL